MRIEPQRPLFVGVRIDNKLRDALAHCPPRDKAYFDGSDPRYLRVLRGVEESYIGKVVDPGQTAVAVDDLKRNILSLLARLGSRRSDDDVRVFACDEGEPPPIEEPPPPPDRYY
jgi:hypothetical protein